MLCVVESAGHPRDMGLDQGRALSAPVRAAAAGAGLPVHRRRLPSLAPFTSGPVRSDGVARETIRHYTHLAERMDGLARGAGVPIDSILSLHAKTACLDTSDLEARPAVAISAIGLQDSPGVTLARSLPGASRLGSSVVVRRSRPAVGFESAEVTVPWLASALAGVNDAGLTACIVPMPSANGEAALAAPSPILLVQESLQRFESVEAAVDWASSRPAWGFATLLLADADGERAAVCFEGGDRRVERAADAPQAAGRPGRIVDALCEAAAGERVLDEKALCPPDDSASAQAWVRLVPTRRSLEIKRPSGPREELRVEV